ncbi:MAG TPA: DUF4421 family protein [Bacteroidales bacterium]|nr:DUF4421 family protein [Bacteroidales bacterium]
MANNTRNSLLVGLGLLCFIASSFAQTDSLYIQNYQKNVMLKAFFYNQFLELNVETANQDETDYLSNNPVNIGFGVTHPKIPLEISFGFNLGTKADENYLRTKSFDLQITKYGRMYVADITAKRYKGFYNDKPKLSYEEANFPDLAIDEIGVAGQYVFNGQKFSYRAAFNQSEKQIKSAGSFLLGGGLYYFHVMSDSLSLLDNKNKLKSYQLGVNGGYGHNWVIKKYWLVNGSFSLGANIGNSNIENFFDKHLYVTPMALVRSSCFYNKKNWYLGLSFVVNMATLAETEEKDISISAGRAYFTYIRKFEL